jgi:hypothetical protein
MPHQIAPTVNATPKSGKNTFAITNGPKSGAPLVMPSAMIVQNAPKTPPMIAVALPAPAVGMCRRPYLSAIVYFSFSICHSRSIRSSSFW